MHHISTNQVIHHLSIKIMNLQGFYFLFYFFFYLYVVAQDFIYQMFGIGVSGTTSDLTWSIWDMVWPVETRI